MSKIDDMRWHFGGRFPADLPTENAATLIGFFLRWAAAHNLLASELMSRPSYDALLEDRLSGAKFLITECDGRLAYEDLVPEGLDFAKAYYSTDQYYDDCADVFGDDHETLYHVADTLGNLARISDRLDSRFAKWRSSRNLS